MFTSALVLEQNFCFHLTIFVNSEFQLTKFNTAREKSSYNTKRILKTSPSPTFKRATNINIKKQYIQLRLFTFFFQRTKEKQLLRLENGLRQSDVKLLLCLSHQEEMTILIVQRRSVVMHLGQVMRTAWLSFQTLYRPTQGFLLQRSNRRDRAEWTWNSVVPITSGHLARGAEHVADNELFTLSPWYVLSNGANLDGAMKSM